MKTKSTLFQGIAQIIEDLKPQEISEERKAFLKPLTDFIQAKVFKGEEIRLIFICTHNSRRSLLAQIWAQALAHHFGILNVFCYSAGTKATTLFHAVKRTLLESHFQFENLAGGPNPVHAILYSPNEDPVFGFSKTLKHDYNPKEGFASIMNCSEADGNCLIVAGAEARFPIPYEDPKAFDGTEQQAEKYRERSLQIATELCYVFAQIKPKNEA